MKTLCTTDPTKLRQIYRLRYQVYIEELGKHFLCDSKHEGLCNDELDQMSQHYYIEEEGQVVAALRCRYYGKADTSNEHLLHLAQQDGARHAVIDRLSVSRSRRGLLHSYALASAVFEDGMAKGIDIGIIECEDQLVNYYRRMGFKLNRTVHRPYGMRKLMTIDTRDMNYLEKVNSPLLRVLRRQSA